MFLPAPAQAKGQNSKLKKVILVKNIFLLLTSQSVKWCGEQSLGQIRIMNKKQKTVLWTGIAVIVLTTNICHTSALRLYILAHCESFRNRV